MQLSKKAGSEALCGPWYGCILVKQDRLLRTSLTPDESGRKEVTFATCSLISMHPTWHTLLSEQTKTMCLQKLEEMPFE